jgi:hypothetical protein
MNNRTPLSTSKKFDNFLQFLYHTSLIIFFYKKNIEELMSEAAHASVVFSSVLPPSLDKAALYPEPVFLNVYGAQESIPRNEFRQPI